jgi:hypothetical protein
MTRTTRPAKPSLRGLAARLGVAHSGLSKLIHDRLLTKGVAFDNRGRVVVTDIEAAAAQWNGIHKVTTADLIRRERRAPADTGEGDEDDEVYCDCGDVHPMFAELSKQDLVERWAAYDLLVNVLLVSTLDEGGDPSKAAAAEPAALALVDRIAPRLRATALRRGADETSIDMAESLFLEMVREVLHPDPEDIETPTSEKASDEDAGG